MIVGHITVSIAAETMQTIFACYHSLTHKRHGCWSLGYSLDTRGFLNNNNIMLHKISVVHTVRKWSQDKLFSMSLINSATSIIGLSIIPRPRKLFINLNILSTILHLQVYLSRESFNFFLNTMTSCFS